ncbi:hypothetical protein MMC11_001188 [Xylographa trunciseda]|nr:hypothetical protein [Xylographa trunciseda]
MDEYAVDSFCGSEGSNDGNTSSSEGSISEKVFTDCFGLAGVDDVLMNDITDGGMSTVENAGFDNHFWLLTILSSKARFTTRLLSVPTQTKIAKLYKPIAAAFDLQEGFTPSHIEMLQRIVPHNHPGIEDILSNNLLLCSRLNGRGKRVHHAKTMKDLTDAIDGAPSLSSLQVTIEFFDIIDIGALEGIAEVSFHMRRVQDPFQFLG